MTCKLFCCFGGVTVIMLKQAFQHWQDWPCTHPAKAGTNFTYDHCHTMHAEMVAWPCRY